MEFRTLDQSEYDAKLRSVIVGMEGLHPHVQDVGDGRATVGWGYTLNRGNNVDIWTRAGIELTPNELDTLRRIDREPTSAGKTRLGLTFARVLSEAESDSLFRASMQEYEAPALEAGMPLSDERVAVVSATYNRGVAAIRNHPLMEAIRDGARAEAWYELRYNCWGSRTEMEGGLRKRRFAEAEVFGLHDDRQNVPVEESADVYTMYRNHRTEMDRVERAYGEPMDGTASRPNRLAQANRDYPGIVDEYGAVRTISASLEPSRTVLIAHLASKYPPYEHLFSEAHFNAGEIDLQRFPVQAAMLRDEAPAPHTRPDAISSRPDPIPGHQIGLHPGPFADPTLNRMLAAVAADDSAQAAQLTVAYADSPRGEAFLQRGEERLALPHAGQAPLMESPVVAGYQDFGR